MKCPGLVADDLSGFWRFSKPGDRDATGGTDGAVSGGIGAVSGRAVELCRGGRAARGQRAALPPAARPVRGKRRRGPDRSPASGRRAPVDRIEFVVEQYRTRYGDFTVKHFHEALQAEHGFALGYTWTKTVLQSRGLVAIAPRRAAHRKKRPRRPLPGMMLFQDGAPHAWLAGQAPLDLIVTLDDATSAIYSMFLVEEEGTASSFGGLDEVISRHGLFSSLYIDRGSHYFTTPKAGGTVDKQQPTQVGRALAELRIEHIPSYSPEARGRMERVFGTLQQRLPPLLRLNGITTIEAANRYLAETYLPEHNARFAVAGRGRQRLRAVRGRFAGHPVHQARTRGRTRQLCALRRTGLADPRAAAPPSLRQGDRPGARVSRSHNRAVPRPQVPCRLHRGRHPDLTAEPNQISRLSPLGGEPRGFVDNASRYPQPHRAINHRSGHIMCYEKRTSLRATNTTWRYRRAAKARLPIGSSRSCWRSPNTRTSRSR